MSKYSDNSSATKFLGGTIAAAILVGILLLLLLLLGGWPHGGWVQRPQGPYACLCAALVTIEGILLGLFICGCALLLSPMDGSITINRPSTVLTLFGGTMALAGALRVLLLFGTAIGIFSNADLPSMGDRDKAAKEKYIAKMKAKDAVARAESEQSGGELVKFFETGGTWNTELVPNYDEVRPELDPSPLVDSGSRGTGPPLGAGAAGPSYAPPPPKVIVLIIGPADFVTRMQSVRFRTTATPDNSVPPPETISTLASRSDSFNRNIYVDQKQRIAAAVVEVERPVAESPQGGAGASAAGLKPSLSSQGGDLPTGAAGPIIPELADGAEVPLKNARLVTAEEFKKLAPRIVAGDR
jgi:hypothetical protein